MKFIGVDLAWSYNNKSGICVLSYEDNKLRLKEVGVVDNDDDILSFVDVNGTNHVAIDAPLVVPNKTGRRPAEDVCSKLFRKYEAGPYPANRNWLERDGKIRGEELSKKLIDLGFLQDPYLDSDSPNVFYEVYPHPAIVTLFNLDKSLKYKQGKKRSYKDRYEAFSVLVSNLKNLDIEGTLFLDEDYTSYRGKALKEFEDKVDALFCAYIAYYNFSYNSKCLVMGNLKEGYIVSPVFEHMKK